MKDIESAENTEIDFENENIPDDTSNTQEQLSDDSNLESTKSESPSEKKETIKEVQVDQTKEFARRLKEEVVKAKDQERENIAKSFGYSDWNEYVEAQTNSKIIEKGLNPDEINPLINEVLERNPKYIEAMKYKEEKEALEKRIWEETSLKDLNDKFGTTFNSINSLDAETIELWNKGISLDKAYAANNYTKLIKPVEVQQPTGKEHIQTSKSGATPTDSIKLSKEQFRVFRQINGENLTDKEILEYVAKSKNK